MTEIQILNNGDTLYDIRRKINENFELVQQEVEEIEESVEDPIVKFGVNEGNTTDGVADLLDATDGTLSFKVGGEYPNLVTTSGDGITTQIESVNGLHLQNLADGEYTIVVNGSQSQITDAEFYSQLLEPENPTEGDVWFNGENAVSFNAGVYNVEAQIKQSIDINCIANIGDLYVAAGKGNKVLKSFDGGQSWQVQELNSPNGTGDFLTIIVKDATFHLISNTGLIYTTKDLLSWSSNPIINTNSILSNVKELNGYCVAVTTEGILAYSTNLTGFNSNQISAGNDLIDAAFTNNLYYVLEQGGGLYQSPNLQSWVNVGAVSGVNCMSGYGNEILLLGSKGVIHKFNVLTKTSEQIELPVNETVRYISVLQDGSVLVVGDNNLCSISKDLKSFEQIYSSGGNLKYVYNDFMVGAGGTILKLNSQGSWVPYPYIPVGEVIISGGEITYAHTYPYNSNGLHEASSSTFGLLRTAAVKDEMDCSCNNAVITPSNLYNISNYRIANTEYKVGDTVGCPYHHGMTLRCTTAGTTSQEALDTNRNLNAGETIIDGTVVWTIETTNTSNFLNKQQITNCLLEVPQRIKYELTDGTLTVKAGSVVIVPYGNLDRTFYKCGDVTFDETTSIASNFSATNYIETHDSFTLGDTWEIVTKFTTGDDITTNQNILSNGRGVALNIANSKLSIYLGSDGSTFDIASAQAGTSTLSLNTTYKVKIGYDGTTYTMSSSTDDITWIPEYTLASTDVVKTGNKLKFGFFSGNIYFRGSIDFSETSTTIDGEQRFNTSEQLTTKYPVGATFLHDNFKVADTQFADGRFFVWAELVEDVVRNAISTTNTTERWAFLRIDANGYDAFGTGVSGTEAVTNSICYRTDLNKCVCYNTSGAVKSEVCCLPFMKVLANGIYVEGSVTQVFNGMGYIGGVVWLDKGVKGLIPNGRNEDGSLKNVEFEVPSIIIGSRVLTQEFIPVWYQSNNTIVFSKGWEYVEATNKVTATQDGVTTQDFCQIATVDMNAGVISNFQPKQPFHAANIQDVVRKTGDTMSGTLELYGTSSHLGLFGGSIFTHNMNISMDTAPSSNIYFPVVEHQDKNNTRKSRVESFYKTDGSHGVQLSEKHGSSYSAVTAGFDANGKAYTYAPHCDITNGIVTQAALSKAKNGYIKFGNGLIIQWGTFKPVSKGTGTVTFPTAWSSANANFGLALTQAQQGPTDDYANSICTGSVTATTFTYQTGHTEQPYYRFVAVGY